MGGTFLYSRKLCLQTDILRFFLKRFEHFLKSIFKDSVGGSWVDAGKYEIADEAGGAILNMRKWSDSIKPGMTLSMAMILWKQQVSGNRLKHTCPSCHSPYNAVKRRDLERVRW